MGIEHARAVAEAAADALSQRDAGARAVVADAIDEVLSSHEAALVIFDAYLADPSGPGTRNAFVAALTEVMSTDPEALGRVQQAVKLTGDRPHTPTTPLPRPGSNSDNLEAFTPPSGHEEGLEAFTPPDRHDEGVANGHDPAAGGPPAPYPAYPYIRPPDQTAGQEYLIQPEVPFPLDIGLSKTAPVESAIVATPAGLGEVHAGMTVQVQLSYDPASLSIDGPTPIVLQLTPDDPFPRHTVTVTPLPTARPLSNRRIAAHYLVDGKVRAIAFRTFRDADAPPGVKAGSAGLIDLTPLADEEAPDLVLAIYGADAASPGTFTIAAFPRDADVAPPEIGRIELGPDAADFMTLMFKEGNRGGDPTGVYDNLTGIGWRIGEKIPGAIFQTLKAVAEDPDRGRAATMLLLTEESAVPWELATVGGARDITSAAGGSSPFLGAHFAIGRWPVEQSVAASQVPDPRRIDVRKAALVRADYEGVGDGWRPLPGAATEVADLTRDYSPVETWEPLIDEVKENLFQSDVDVIHFALHGQVEETPGQSGLVLLRREGDKVRPAYLSAEAILSLLTRDPGPPMRSHPLIFLNACQVGQGQEILGDYAGLATAFIAAGARAVVACIWNVNDGVAGSISREFYRRADANEAPAEILRSVRTRYVRPEPAAPAPADPATASVPTLIAYQYFGHPGMRVVRSH